MSREKIKTIIGLDLLRFFAAVLVVMFHLTYCIWAGHVDASVQRDFSILQPWVWFGWIGVEIFFLISGFVIALSASAASPWLFFRSRTLRLVPAAWICASITAAVLLLDHVPIWHVTSAYLYALTFWPFGRLIDSSYWTLGVELCFYALVFVLLALRRFDLVGPIVGALGVVSTAFWITVAATGYPPLLALASFESRGAQLVLQYNSFFAIGVLLFTCVTDRTTPSRIALIVICLIGSFIEIYFHSLDMLNLGQDLAHRETVAISLTYAPMLTFGASCLLIWLSILWNDRVLNVLGGHASAVRRLGLMTYPLYLIHQRLGYSVIGHLKPSIGAWSALLTAIALCVLVSLLVSTLGEPALRKALSFCIDGIFEWKVSARIRSVRSGVEDVAPWQEPPTPAQSLALLSVSVARQREV